MFFPIPMKLSNHRTGRSLPAANVGLVFVNVLFYLWASPETCWVGPGTGLLTVLTYGFVHAGFAHLLFNMWALWVFGNAVNRRVGNGMYLTAYLGAIVSIGLVAKLFSGGHLLGASGGVFAVAAMAALLMPSARVLFHYIALFPLTLMIGLGKRPEYPLFWFIRWGTFAIPAVSGLVLVPVLELMGLIASGTWHWTHLAHLLGFVAGIAAVLLLPPQVSMRREVVSA
jgi:membrane associated rhomboid family serine protease